MQMVYVQLSGVIETGWMILERVHRVWGVDEVNHPSRPPEFSSNCQIEVQFARLV